MNGVRTFGALTATPQPFEEALLAAPVWRVTAAGAVRPEDLSILVDAAHARGVGLIACRLPEGDPAVEALAAAGFRTVETLLTFEGTIRDDAAMPGNIRPARIGDVAACREIATATFRHDRFHADPAIDDAVAAALKAQ